MLALGGWNGGGCWSDLHRGSARKQHSALMLTLTREGGRAKRAAARGACSTASTQTNAAPHPPPPTHPHLCVCGGECCAANAA
eukprot:127944-Rhodomonas_salina.1